MTVLYGTNTANSTLTNACNMVTSTGGTETSKTTTFTGTSTNAEIFSQGGSTATSSSIGSPSGHGWTFQPGAGTFATGNWSATVTLSSVSIGRTVTIRFYKYSSGTYTSIGTIAVTNTPTAKTANSFAATSMSSVTFGASDLLYVDLWWFDGSSNAGGDNPTVYIANSSTVGVASDMQVTTSTFTPSGSTVSRTITPVTVALQSLGLARTVPSTAALQSLGLARTIPSTVALLSPGLARTISPVTAALTVTSSRTVPATTALTGTVSRTIPTTVALQSLGNPRTIPASAALLSPGLARVISPVTAALTITSSRTIPATVALQSLGLARTVPASAALTITSSRTIPASASITMSAVFYASNIAQTTGSLILSDQMSMVNGGTETSYTVTMPSSGTNTYVELLAQGGSSSATSSLPSPTGKGWSINLAGNTILGGYWSFAFTLAKSGTSMSGASLIVRAYRRTMDGTVYPIAVTTLAGETFSTTKTVYVTPSVLNSFPWQFVAGETLYMDAFVLNPTTAWASDVFTVYVSNSATQGVYNDGIIIAPEMITTPTGLSCMIGATAFQTGATLPVLNQSFTIADAVDQRSILTLTGEDVNGTQDRTPNQPVIFSDHDQGKLYDGYLASDKVSRPAAGGSSTQLEHMMTFADHHRDYDKEKNTTNYVNWSGGDIACDIVLQQQYKNGVWGEFAMESDYTPATLGAGTLTNTVATNTTSPFTYAPNTATPPITSNTGDLELVRAGTQFTLTESVTSDFSSGTLTNMVAANNELSPTTQSAIKVTALYSPVATAANQPAQESGGIQTDQEQYVNLVDLQIWSGSLSVGSSDTFNYDVWIASTSPVFLCGMDLQFNDGTWLTNYNGTLDSNTNTGLFDQNSVTVDTQQDLSAYAKDTWYTRSITLTGLSGKSVVGAYVYLAGSASGTYTVFVKNAYLGSHSGSPFFSTTATATQLNPPSTFAIGGYLASTINSSVVQVYNPLSSYRVSPAHSISSVGLIQNSTITWTASEPSTGAAAITYPPGTQASSTSTTGGGTMVMLVSYDGNCWLSCTNSQALPGLPPGANVSGLSLYLREQFAAGSDPSAIPALLEVQITINSAASQTVSDIVTAYGTSTQWNTGTQILTNPNGAGNLTLGGSSNPMTQSWSSSSVLGHQTFLAGPFNNGTQAVSGGAYTMTPVANTGGSWCQSRFDWAGYFLNGTIEADVKISSTANYNECGIEYRQTGWGNANNNGSYYVAIGQGGSVFIGFGSNSFSNTAGTFQTIGTVNETINANTYYHLKVVVQGNRHTIYFNHASTPTIDVLDSTYTGAGMIGFRAFTSSNSSFTASIDNFSMITTTSGTWTSPSTSLTSLGTCGYSQIAWTDLDSRGQVEATTTVLASVDGGSTWMQCTNGAQIPQLARGTSTSGKSLVLQAILYSATPPISTPVMMGLYVRICGNYGTVTGTRISPALSLTPVGYVGNSNCMWNANVPTSTTLTVQTTQDLASFHTVGSNGAGEALPYWSNQPQATQDLFSTVTSSNYTSTSKTGGSVASVTYTTTNSSLTLTGGSGALYLNNAISCSDVDLLCHMDKSDAGGFVWHYIDGNNFYELGVYDASSSGGFTNQLRLYKVASGTRSLLGSASVAIFTRGTLHCPRVKMEAGLINVYWDGACVQSYLDTSPLAGGACGLRNDGGTSRYYQLWVQPLGTNLSGQKLHTVVTMSTSDPSVMPQLFTLVCCVRGPSIGTGATIEALHPVTQPFAAYYSSEMDTITQASSDTTLGPYYWYVDRWRQLHFRPRLALPGAFPVQSTTDQDPANPANVHSGYLLYTPQVSVLSSADLFRNQQVITNASSLTTPPPEVKVSDGSTTSWTMGYPLYSAPVITINGQPATVGLQGVDNNRQFYWQHASASISYDSSLPKLPAGTVLTFTYTGQSPANVILDNLAAQSVQAALELNSGIIAEIESALQSTTQGMTTSQATTFGNGLLARFGNNAPIELIGTTQYAGLVPGTVIGAFVPEEGVWNAQLPIVKLTTSAFMTQNGLMYFSTVDATNGPSLSNWTRVFSAK